MAQGGGTEVEPAYPMSHSNGAEDPARPRKLEFAGQSTGEKRPRPKEDSVFCRGSALNIEQSMEQCMPGRHYLSPGKISSGRIRQSSVKILRKARNSDSSH